MAKNDTEKKIFVLGKSFNTEEERRTYFREELRKKLPELKKMEGFPIGDDEDILNLSDAPYYTACPNPWLNDFIAEWEEEKKELEKQGKRSADFEVSEPYASDVSEGKNNPIYNAHSYHTKVPHPAIMRYILHYTQPGDIVFDGFAGTGMTGVAASMCEKPEAEFRYLIEKENNHIKWGNRRSICSDLSPIASFISSNFNSNYSAETLSLSAKEISNELKEKFKWMFSTFHNNSNQIGYIEYTIWSDIFICDNCSSESIYFDDAFDRENKVINSVWNCSNCNSLINKKTAKKAFQTVLDDQSNEIIKINKTSPVLINYQYAGKRYTKIPDANDLEVLNKVNSYKINKWIPTNKLPIGFNTSQPINSNGITHVHLFYTKRTLIILSELFAAVPNKFLLTNILSRNATKLNRFVVNKHNPKGRINGPLAGTLYIPSESVEQNPINLFLDKIPNNSWLLHGAVTEINSATNLSSHKSEIFDYIFVDPPFGANIMYSDLNIITESWLKVRTNQKEEAIENKFQNKDFLAYTNLMLKSFKEFNRLLKPGKWMTVEFSNTSAAIWNGIQTAIQNSGFIVANISALDKKHGGIRAMAYSTSVNQDLIISCYKPSSLFDKKFEQHQNSEVGIWDFVIEHLGRLPIHLVVGNSTTAIVERSPKILFDRLIAFYVQKGLPVPIDAGKFQQGLRERFIERDGMFFTNEQVQEYDRKKAAVPNFTQLSIFVACEQDSIYWLRNLLEKDRKTESDLYPFWMKEVAGNMRKGDNLPEMRTILEENFLKDDQGKWYIPDPESEADLEKLRNKRLLKQFEVYKTEAANPKAKIKEVRVESLRAGFKQCYQDKDFKTIVIIGDRIPNNLLMEDEVLLQFYDIASSRI